MKKTMILLFGLLFLFISCGKENNIPQKNKKDTLIVAQDGEPKSLDIHQGNDGFSLRANKLIYSRLVESDGDMNIVPGLAESWEQLDDRTTLLNVNTYVTFYFKKYFYFKI